jgi:hypothetical protein
VKFLSKCCFTALLVFILTIFVHTALFADDSLSAPLMEIPGWQAEEVQTMDMDMNGVKITNAMRSYEKGDAAFDAVIMISSLQMGLASFQQMNMSQGGIKIETSQVNGFSVMHSHDSNVNEGTLMILLGQTQTSSALFSLTYESLSEEESMTIVKKYDWKTIQKAVQKLMK